MLRWIAWFALGPVLMVTSLSGLGSKVGGAQAVGLLLAAGLWLWCIVTFFAVIIKLVLWLVRGRRENVPPIA